MGKRKIGNEVRTQNRFTNRYQGEKCEITFSVRFSPDYNRDEMLTFLAETSRHFYLELAKEHNKLNSRL